MIADVKIIRRFKQGFLRLSRQLKISYMLISGQPASRCFSAESLYFQPDTDNFLDIRKIYLINSEIHYHNSTFKQ